MARHHEPREERVSEDLRSRRDREAAQCDDPLDVFTRDLDLPRDANRERVEEYSLRRSEARILASVAVFRAIPREDLEEVADSSRRSLTKDVEHLRSLGLLESRRYVTGRDRCQILTLTDRGRLFMEGRQLDDGRPARQTYRGRTKDRELAHDSRLFRAYLDAADRIVNDGGRITRVRLDDDLKRDYQIFLQEPNRRRRDSSGQPRRDWEAIARWANEQDLPIVDDSVKFPDLRIEYERPDGARCFEDVEVLTPHYRGAHLSSKKAAGFSCYRYGSARIGGARTSNRGGRGRDSRLAEEMLK